jgi:hypothetical protein
MSERPRQFSATRAPPRLRRSVIPKVKPQEVSEPLEGEESESAEAESASPSAPWRFWRTLFFASVLFGGMSWVLDALPPRTGEPLFLRWLRALEAHPIRVPLGWTLAWMGGVRLVRTVFRRPERTTRA